MRTQLEFGDIVFDDEGQAYEYVEGRTRTSRGRE